MRSRVRINSKDTRIEHIGCLIAQGKEFLQPLDLVLSGNASGVLLRGQTERNRLVSGARAGALSSITMGAPKMLWKGGFVAVADTVVLSHDDRKAPPSLRGAAAP